ncbi:NACHT domain-containing protein [Actinomadura xylanilytica]|uniref:NACHT domain-containing protein n=1 Tax=Actinomadura xylanilytica TaxID=887459 RepID=UPI00255B0390|nr:NACHT domain-containing protein [Actinomadura xylanilytica]MDL4774498.1 NACHT domain-containing protein [Actinomadura xylanilytica]
MSVEMAAFGVGRSVVQLAAGRWLAGRSARDAAGRDLAELVRIGIPDEIKRRRAHRQFEDIADSVAERLLTFARHEYGGLAGGDREAALHEAVRTLDGADLSDEAFFAADADPVKLSRGLRSRLPARTAGFELGEAGARLYETVLDEACDCLARIMIHLPQFAPRASVEALGRLTGLADQVGAVLARLPARSLMAPEGEADDTDFTRRYLASISENLDTLELFGVRFERLTRPQTALSVAYISLNVSEEGGARRPRTGAQAVPVDAWRAEARESGAVRVESALSDHRLTLLRGEAGGGKSTLLRWLAVTAARGRFTGDLAGWNDCVPFMIKLRSHPDGPLPRPEEYLDDMAGNLAGIMPRGWAHRRLASGRALLLVDGVDEVTGTRRQAVRQWIKELVAEFRGVRVIVTSRPAAAGSDWLRAEGFATVFLEQLGPADLRALVQHWHSAVRHCDDLPCTPERLPSYEAKLLARLEAAPHLRTLASSPLLAAMLCALNLDRETLPRDRMGLYTAALDLLLETRDAKRGIPSAAGVSLERDQKVRILQDLAWHLSTSARVELPKPMVERLVADRLATMPQVRASAAAVLELLLQRSGVIREPVPDRIDFVHRTVQEYLTAKQAADLGDMDLLVQNAHRDHWRETVIMAAGHANEPLRRELITGVLGRVAAEPKRARRLKLLAVACLETLPSVPADLRQALDTCLDDLTPPRDTASSRSLATAGEAVLSRLPATLGGLSDAVAVACVRAAWLINGPEALDVLTRYAPDPREVVQIELNEAWDYFDPQEYAERVLAKAPTTWELRVNRSPRQMATLRALPPRTGLHIRLVDPVDLGPLEAHAQALEELQIDFTTRSEKADLTLLPALPQLRRLTMSAPWLDDLDFLDRLPRLDRIWLADFGEVTDYAALARQSALRALSLLECHHLIDLEMLPPLGALELLNLNESRLNCGLAELMNVAPKVRYLYLNGCPWVTDLAALAPSRLDLLNLDNCAIDDLSALDSQTSLLYLGLRWTNVSDLTALARMHRLKWLWLNGCERVSDLEPLAALPDLRDLHIAGIAPGTDLTPLAGNRKLTVHIKVGQEVRGAETLGRRLKIS